jgi:hypothetical protein
MARRVSFETQSEEITGAGDVTFSDLNEHNFHTITIVGAGTIDTATDIEAEINGNDFPITNFNKPDDATSAVAVIAEATPGTVSINCNAITVTVDDAAVVTLSSYR